MSNEAEATSLLGQIPFGAIIGGPLRAAVEAQGAAAVACYDFISKVGFETPPLIAGASTLPAGGGAADGNVGGAFATGTSTTSQATVAASKVRVISFIFERKRQPDGTAAGGGGTTSSSETLSVTVPLLTIMPLPFIRIESMTLNFKTAITAVDSSDVSTRTTTEGSADLKGSLNLGPIFKVDMGGSISSKKDSTATNSSKYSVEHTIDVSVHAVQDDMPAGLARILSIMTAEIAAVTVPAPQPNVR